MSYKVLISSTFKRKAKPLLKKYPSLKSELSELGRALSENPAHGTALGNNCYKIRLAIHSKGVGKRGGARVITYVITEDEQVVLLTIYDKKDKTDLMPGELAEILNDLSF
jgi:mRNA-degrading endonuclease RelE of RelBE toxin-antitoxin system